MAKTSGAVIIDEKNMRFRVTDAYVSKNKSIVGTMAKGTLAVATMGVSLIAGALMGSGKTKTKWIPFGKLMEYDVRQETTTESKGKGTGTAIFGIGFGRTSSTTKTVIQSMEIVIACDDLDCPVIVVPIIEKPLKGSAFDKAQRYGDETVAGLEYIQRHKS